jgi:hypothetical protein
MRATRVADLHVPRQTRLVLERVGELLEQDTCWLYQRKYHFKLDREGVRTLAVSEDSGGRFRLETCVLGTAGSTLWTLSHDDARLAAVVRELGEERGARVSA